MELKEIKLIHTIKLSIENDAKMLPRFIDNSKVIDKEVYELGKSVIRELIPLISYQVAKNSLLNRINYNINMLFDDMVKLSPDLSILYYEHLNLLMSSYGDLFLANELYEAKANFDNLKNKLDGKTI